ncbi:MAG TPA: ExeM/NucH family extracellular endonuclease [Gammaproteobacteria bacterium]|nr:ExeM/NucH family extracellular endonuclease [Gammaproteobacteria bacterium]
MTGLLLALRSVAVLALTVSAAAFAGSCPAGNPLSAIRNGTVPDGQHVTVTATLVGRFPGRGGLDGFYLQQSTDGGPPSGLFVYTPGRGGPAIPAVGTRVSVRGRVGEYQGSTQLEWVSVIHHCGRTAPRTTTLTLPASRKRLARLAGTRVSLAGPLTVSDNHDLAHWGTLGLAVGGRLFHPDTGVRGGRPAGVLLDDGSDAVNPTPTPYLDDQGTRRVGDTVTSLTGILARRYGHWRIYPVLPVRFRRSNPRPEPPTRSRGLRLVSFNLHNFFQSLDGRGATTEAARRRQRERLQRVTAALNADVLALQEIENRPGAMTALLGLLNHSREDGPYAGAVGAVRVGDGVIRTAIVYRRDRVALEDVDILDEPVHDRAPIRAVFRTESGRRLAVVVVHFKSKGGCPADQPAPGPEGCWSGRRARQAASLAQWLRNENGDPVATYVLGDFNSYAQERAPRRLAAAGFEDLVAAEVPPAQRYSYVYRGRSGYLDYAFANGPGVDRVRSVSVWHINADEPPFAAGEGPWRSSDHDPVIVDIGDGYGN